MSVALRKILVIFFMLLLVFVIVNLNNEVLIVKNNKILNIFLLSDLNREAISSLPNFLLFIQAKLVFNPIFRYLLIGLLLSVIVFACTLYSKKTKKEKNNDLEEILRKVLMVYDETVDSGKRDNQGKIIFELISHIPMLDFSPLKEDQTFLIKNIHPKVRNNVDEYLKGLLSLLKQAEKIEVDAGMIEETGFPGEMRVILLSPEVTKRQRLESVFNKAGLFFKETIGVKTRLVYPKIKENEDGNLIVDVSGVNITQHQLENAIPIISKEFDRDYIFVTSLDNSTYEIHASKPAVMAIPKGHTIVANIDLWREGVVQKLKEKWEKEKQFYWYFGDLRDSSYKLSSNEIIISGDDLVHAMIIGATGSGKTESTKSICATLQEAYGEKIQIFYANGALSTDLDSLCLSYSPIGNEAAKPYGNSEDEMLSRLLHILSNANSIKEERDLMFKEATREHGIECKKVVEYRRITGVDIPEILIVIDEFAGYSQLFDYDTNVSNVGSVAYYLQVGFSQYRKFGIHFLIATQEMKAKSIPRRLFSNISGGLVMKIAETDYKYMNDSLDFNFEGLHPTSFSRGDGLFWNSSIRCSLTNKSRIPVGTPFIGSDTMELVNLMGGTIDPSKKQEYDVGILNLGDKDLAPGGFESKLKKLQIAIEKCLLVREGWVVYRKENPTHKIMNLYAKFNSNEGSVLKEDKTIQIAFVTADDVLSHNFKDRLGRENISSTDLTIYFINGKVTPKNMLDIKDILEGDYSTLCLFQSDFTSVIRQAYELYKSKESTEVFNILLENIESSIAVKNKKAIEDLYSHSVSPSVVSVAMLDKIRRQEGAAKKGESFESLWLAIESSAGHDSVHGKELALDKIVDLKLANSQADGGLDVVRWIDREKKICTGFQLKNQMSRAVSNEVVDKLVKTRELYQKLGITFKDFYLVTTGEVTRQAYEEALKLGFGVINGKQLDDMIRTMGARTKLQVEDFNPLIEKPVTKIPSGPIIHVVEDIKIISAPTMVLPVAISAPEVTIKSEVKKEPSVVIKKDKPNTFLSYPDFMAEYESIKLNKNISQGRGSFTNLCYEFLKISGYDVKQTASLEGLPKSVHNTVQFIYIIDQKKIGISIFRNNSSRPLEGKKSEQIIAALKAIESLGYTVVRKDVYLVGKCLSASRKILEKMDFNVVEDFIEEVGRKYLEIEIRRKN